MLTSKKMGERSDMSWALRVNPATERDKETICWLAADTLDAQQTLAFVSLCYEYNYLRTRVQKGHTDEITSDRIALLATLLKSEFGGEERRSYLRRSLRLRAMIKAPQGERSASVRDGSVGGFWVQSKQILRVGSTVQVTIVLAACMYVFRCQVVRAAAEMRTFGLRVLGTTL